jgi:hypothetical protein
VDKLILHVKHIFIFLREFDPEFRLVANSWLGSGNDPSRVYFGVLDFKNGREIYGKVKVLFKNNSYRLFAQKLNNIFHLN